MQGKEPLEIVGDIYRVAMPGEGWEQALEDLADMAGAGGVSLVLAIPRLHMVSVVSPRSDPEVIDDFCRFWHRKDITRNAMLAAPERQLMSLKDIGRERFLKSEFYNEFWKGSGHTAERLAANLVNREGRFASIGLHARRQDEDISPDMWDAFLAMIPHLQRAVEIRCQLRQAELERQLAQQVAQVEGKGKAALLVGAGGHLLASNAAAEGLFSRGDAIGVRHGLLTCRTPAETERLTRLIENCGADAGMRRRGGSLNLRTESGGTLQIRVLPAPPGSLSPDFGDLLMPGAVALVLIDDPAARMAEALVFLRDRFGLTPAESRVALELLRGDGRNAVAQRLGISPATVRSHMMHLFEKTGMTRQAELVRLLALEGLPLDLPPPSPPHEE
ncbi:helix-turn-helix transcriptional regulator [Frigidibacter sp. ROC022]|uniref:helix-turn-helix transcriptional regulator n=1 Tax=Frigidibacter sp. ROC022 TaxID=2971796 RepID=UPI00215A50F2|nr:helix-turn-helix transcriptional regulator [Frigidibacter sp. ROC022]MCR8723599.1 helix-turn-helix transcriptional regulator [Frigidibacter sp. ROC022]